MKINYYTNKKENMNFDFYSPTKICFGRGRIKEIGEAAKDLGTRLLLVYGQNSLKKSGIINEIEDILKKNGIDYILYGNLGPDPKSKDIDEIIRVARSENVNLIAGIGGGSVIDAAKAIACGFDKRYSTIKELIGQNLPSEVNALPIIAIPTTAGTGSEVTKGAIITDSDRNFKSGIRGNAIFPKVAIIDPKLTSTLPNKIAMETAFDSFTHAVETYICRRANPISRALSHFSLNLLAKTFPYLTSDNMNEEVEDKLCLAALLGGINVSNCGTCLPHRLQQAMGALPNVSASHPQGVASIYYGWLPIVYTFVKNDLDEISNIFDEQNFISFFYKICSEMKLDKSLSEMGVQYEDIQTVIDNITGAVENDPIQELNQGIIKKVLLNSLERHQNYER